MSPDSKIYVAEHRGLAGSAIVRRLQAKGYRNIVARARAELDLTDAAAVRKFFDDEHPQVVFLAAGKVGGILANNTYPAEFIHQNLAIEANVIDGAQRSGVQDLLFLGSSCIYPRDCPQPIKEEYLLTGPLEPTNRPYAIAKISGIELCWSYNRQYGTRYFCAMPTNLYGPNDHYDLQTSHVLPALIRKFHEAKEDASDAVTVWGSGTPRREFLYSDDMADGCLHLMEAFSDAAVGKRFFNESQPPLVNIGFGEDQTIRELAEVVRDAVGAKVEITHDRAKPDGTPQKLLDVSKLAALGWRARTSLAQGVRLAYQDFLKSRKKVGIS
jgi:GDP-L-fucose synthase